VVEYVVVATVVVSFLVTAASEVVSMAESESTLRVVSTLVSAITMPSSSNHTSLSTCSLDAF